MAKKVEKVVKAEMHQIGHAAFIGGVILAIITGFLGRDAIPASYLVLVILGIVVGFLNIKAKETTEFLVASIALIVAGTASGVLTLVPVIGATLQLILTAIAVFVAPAAIIVALKAVKTLAER